MKFPKHHHAHPAEVNQGDHPQLTNAKIYTVTIAANQNVLLPAPNTHFFIISSTGPIAVMGDTFSQIDGLTTGQGMNNLPFNKLTLIDQSGSANTVKILIAPGEFTNQIIAATVSLSSSTIQAMRQSGSFSNGSFSVTTASQTLVAANSGRQYLLVQNNDSAAIVYLAFGAIPATAATGIKLSPGQSYIQENIVATNSVQIIGSAATTNVILVTG